MGDSPIMQSNNRIGQIWSQSIELAGSPCPIILSPVPDNLW